MSGLRIINPAVLGVPRGYSNGVVAPAGCRLLFVAGQIGWDENQKMVEGGFAAQLARALDNLLQVVANAGGSYEDVVRLTIYVVDRAEYLAAAKDVGVEYRARFGRHYPAMSLFEVAALLEPGARVEIEATAALAAGDLVTVAPRSFRYEFDAKTAVATLTLDRPEKLNALTFEVYDELRATFDALDDPKMEPGVRAVVLTGSGKAFCSGGDVEAIIGELFQRDARGLLEFTRTTGALIRSMIRCRRPIVGALNGTVAGAGAVIAAACDVRIASASAKIAYLFTKVGLSGADMGASWLLPRIVGLGRAAELLMTGDFVDAATAERIGLYHRVVPAEECVGVAREWAERLARGPSFALEVTKRMLYREAAMDLDAALEAEVEIQSICMQDPNFREAYEAFVAKRKPSFR